MCTIEEYAIITFMSLCFRQTILNTLPPTNERLQIWGINSEVGKNGDSRISPYPPNFNKIPASTMEPETGASTCAFGSHRWKKYIGNFTKKAKITIKSCNQEIKLKMEVFTKDKKGKKSENPCLISNKIIKRSGSEANKV